MVTANTEWRQDEGWDGVSEIKSRYFYTGIPLHKCFRIFNIWLDWETYLYTQLGKSCLILSTDTS